MYSGKIRPMRNWLSFRESFLFFWGIWEWRWELRWCSAGKLPIRPTILARGRRKKLLLRPDKALSGWWEHDFLADMMVADILPPRDGGSEEKKPVSADAADASSPQRVSKLPS